MDLLKKINKCLISIFILIQPLLDIIRQRFGADYEIFGISAIELINIVLIVTIFYITVITYPQKRKMLKWLWLIIPFALYLILHLYNTTLFNNEIYPKQTVNFMLEIYYICRMFILPILLVFSIYYSGIKKKELYFIIELLILTISGSILVLNIFKLSYFSYDNGMIATKTIFDWLLFNGNSYTLIATKGWFYSSNQIAAILLMLLPINVFITYDNNKKYNYLLLLLQIISMLILGVKVSNIGCILVLIVFFAIILFTKLVLKCKSKSTLNLIVIFCITLALFLISPRGYDLRKKFNFLLINNPIDSNITNVESGDDSHVDSETNKGDILENQTIKNLNCQKLDSDEEKLLKEYIKSNNSILKIPDYFWTNYSVDSEFWCNYTKQVLAGDNTFDYRKIKTEMINQIYLKNNNKLDKYFGMGHTLNFIYTEQDYSYQFYNYGIIGIILLFGIYFYSFYIGAYKILKDFKKKCTVENLMLLLSVFLGIVVPYFSGHVFERSFPLYILSLVSTINLMNFFDNEKNSNGGNK